MAPLRSVLLLCVLTSALARRGRSGGFQTLAATFTMSPNSAGNDELGESELDTVQELATASLKESAMDADLQGTLTQAKMQNSTVERNGAKCISSGSSKKGFETAQGTLKCGCAYKTASSGASELECNSDHLPTNCEYKVTKENDAQVVCTKNKAKSPGCPDDLTGVKDGKPFPMAYGSGTGIMCGELGTFKASEIVTTYAGGAKYGLPAANGSKYSIVTKGGYWHPNKASEQVIAYAFKRVTCKEPVDPDSDETSSCQEYKIGYCIECPRKNGKKYIDRSFGRKPAFGTDKGIIWQGKLQHEAYTGPSSRDTKNDAKRSLSVRKAAEKCIQQAFVGSKVQDDYTCSERSQEFYKYSMLSF